VAWSLDNLSGNFNGALIDGVRTTKAEGALNSSSSERHQNGSIGLAELVIYVQDIQQTFANFLKAGIVSHKESPPREMKGGKHASIIYFLGKTRLMILGPIDPSMPAEQNPRMWLFGTGKAPAELVGWLPVVKDIHVLKSVLGDKVGGIKTAAQKGRQICSLAPEKSGLTGTFAFLSDGDGTVF
jgi:hypothetical protein